MSVKFTLNLEGGERVRRAFRRVDVLATREVIDAVAETAIDITRMTKGNAPVRTGRLRSSYREIFTRDRLSAEIGTDVEYAPFVEFGTISPPRAPQPHLFPAWEFWRPHYNARMRQAFQKVARRVR